MKLGNAISSFGYVRKQKTTDLPASSGNAQEIDCTADMNAQIAITVDEDSVCTFALTLAAANTNFGAGDYQNLHSGGTTIPIVGETRNIYIKRRDGVAVTKGLSYALVEATDGAL